ncbi:acyltransferase [Nocardioides sp.]
MGKLEIGEGTRIAPNVALTDIDHDYSRVAEPGFAAWDRFTRTCIGARCFIGAGAVILPGTTLGQGSIVGANSVVRGEYPPGTVLGGSPARRIKS